MKRSLSIVLPTAAIGVFVSLTPAVAQVAGNPGDIHDQDALHDAVWAGT